MGKTVGWGHLAVAALRRKRGGKGERGEGGGSPAPLTPSGQLARRVATRWGGGGEGSRVVQKEDGGIAIRTGGEGEELG